ncbi:MAG: phospholipase D family protein [Burkholderiaceae bacterium]|nr:phospholipase D family protein [Burkholderiaceae bacterium]
MTHPERSGGAAVPASVAGAWRRLTRLLGALATLGLAACAGLPADSGQLVSNALPPQPDSALVRVAEASTPAPGLTGVRLLPLGSFALDARLQLVQRARHSLDVQYYVLDDDATGRLLLQRLADAAARGVRVRLLVDDLYTSNTDAMLRAMAALPNVEVRVFNPFCCARQSGLATRFAASLSELYRLNHRMHNKLLLADGALAVAGGRNIADDYFQRGVQHNFVDLDALVIGAVVPELAAIFDRYWNSPVVRTIESVSPTAEPAGELQQRFHRLTADARSAAPLALPEVDLLGYGPIGDDLEGGRLGLVWGRALAISDPPDKWQRDADTAWVDSLAYRALMKIWTADREVTITSPYLIPGPMGISAFEALRQRQVQVTVLTNSLAATDEPLVHTGYSRYRPQLVDAGVELYELSPMRTQRNKKLGVFGSSTGRLHAKTAVVDGDKTFIGSMNLDPRSRTQNTELGLFIESPQLAREMLRVIRVSREQSAYRVQRAPSGGLQWHAVDGDAEQVLLEEPESSVWLQLHNLILGPLVPEQLL